MVPDEVNVNTIIEDRFLCAPEMMSCKTQTQSIDIYNVGLTLCSMTSLILESVMRSKRMRTFESESDIEMPSFCSESD